MMFWLLVLPIILMYGCRRVSTNYLDKEMLRLEAATVHCPHNWTFNPWDNSCIQRVPKDNDDTQNPWGPAQLFCRNLLGTVSNCGLVTITNKKSLASVAALSQGTYSLSYIGYNDDDQDGTYSWVNSNQTKVGLPVKLESGEGCVAMEAKSSVPRLKYVPCDTALPAICEIALANPCRSGNGGCKGFCYPSGLHKRVCACPPWYQLGPHNTCQKVSCAVSNGGCDHICRNGQCHCKKGYKLVGRTRCKDVNECLVLNGGCEQVCNNMPGTFQCHCTGHFKPDNKFCKVHHGPDSRGEIPVRPGRVSSSTIILSVGLTILVTCIGGFMAITEYTQLSRKQASTSLCNSVLTVDDNWDREVNVDENEVREISSLSLMGDTYSVEEDNRHNVKDHASSI